MILILNIPALEQTPTKCFNTQRDIGKNVSIWSPSKYLLEESRINQSVTKSNMAHGDFHVLFSWKPLLNVTHTTFVDWIRYQLYSKLILDRLWIGIISLCNLQWKKNDTLSFYISNTTRAVIGHFVSKLFSAFWWPVLNFSVVYQYQECNLKIWMLCIKEMIFIWN